MVQADYLKEAKKEWTTNSTSSEINHKLKHDPTSIAEFAWEINILWYKGQIYIYEDFEFKNKILYEYYSSLIIGNAEFRKIYHKIKQDFFWKGLKWDIHQFLLAYMTCYNHKGLLQPLAIPSQRW